MGKIFHHLRGGTHTGAPKGWQGTWGGGAALAWGRVLGEEGRPWLRHGTWGGGAAPGLEQGTWGGGAALAWGTVPGEEGRPGPGAGYLGREGRPGPGGKQREFQSTLMIVLS